jgi:type II secretory pathway component GspD/PulD (secretin)
VPKNRLTSLLFTIRALVGKNKATIRSRPRVATQNGEKAVIDISLEEYFSIVTDLYDVPARLRTELKVIKTGVTLEIKPTIGNDGDITVDVATEVSDVASRQNQIEGNASGDLPLVRRRKVDTCVRVKEGDAIVLGGLIETQERTKDKRVPVLSSIPLVGGLFKAKESSTIDKEVVIFITPRLIHEYEDPFFERHSKISVEKELKDLQANSVHSEGRHPPDQNSVETNIKRKSLDAH